MMRRGMLGMGLLTGMALALGLASNPGAAQAQAQGVVVFAAASMKNALDEAAANWAKASGRPAPRISYAASSALAKQIESGAPADLFISADLDWMDYLAKKSLIRSDTRVSLLGNRIVLVGAKASTANVALKPGVDLAALLGSGRLAMGNVDSVPAGKYGKAALEKLGAWDKVREKIAQADNVRAALLLVSRGEAPLGIVYATDAAADPQVKVIATFPEDSHPPIVYPVAQTTESKDAETGAWLKCIESDKAKPIYEEQGFTVLGGSK